jgi:hypothetical protein
VHPGVTGKSDNLNQWPSGYQFKSHRWGKHLITECTSMPVPCDTGAPRGALSRRQMLNGNFNPGLRVMFS